LPAEAQLNIHTDALQFLSWMQQPDFSGELLERLAAATHEEYRKEELKKPQPNKVALLSYDELKDSYPFQQEQNRAAARAYGGKLARIGYAIIPARSNRPPSASPATTWRCWPRWSTSAGCRRASSAAITMARRAAICR